MKKILQISYSSGNTLKECARKFEFDKIYGAGKDGIRSTSLAAEVGTAFHKAYQMFVDTNDFDKGLLELIKCYPHELAMYEAYNKRGIEATISTFEAACFNSPWNEYQTVKIKRPDVVTADGIVPGKVVSASEVPFELLIANSAMGPYDGVSVIGFIDLIMEHKQDGHLLSADIKTHQRPTATRFAEYQFNAQQTPYALVVEHLLGREIKTLKTAYLDCKIDLENPEINVFPFTKTQEDIQEWLFGKVLQLKELKRMVEADFFPRRENGCITWNRPCKYLDVCQSRDKKTVNAWFSDLPERPFVFEPWVTAEIQLGEGLI